MTEERMTVPEAFAVESISAVTMLDMMKEQQSQQSMMM